MELTCPHCGWTGYVDLIASRGVGRCGGCPRVIRVLDDDELADLKRKAGPAPTP